MTAAASASHPAALDKSAEITSNPSLRAAARRPSFRPATITLLLKRLRERYPQLKLHVATRQSLMIENRRDFDIGLSMRLLDDDSASDEDGRIRDIDRYTYYHDHLSALLRAREEGADIRGYMAWSLMDNFEWGYGYSKRFGMLRVDYDTQVRTWKDSAYWYSETIRNREVTPIDAIESLVQTPPRSY